MDAEQAVAGSLLAVMQSPKLHPRTVIERVVTAYVRNAERKAADPSATAAS